MIPSLMVSVSGQIEEGRHAKRTSQNPENPPNHCDELKAITTSRIILTARA